MIYKLRRVTELIFSVCASTRIELSHDVILCSMKILDKLFWL